MKRRRGNGDGSIFKLSGKRRRPYAVRVTIGWTNEGKQEYRYIGYYEKLTQAKEALRKYLTDPTDVIVKEVTLKYVFDSMIENSGFSEGTIKQYRYGFNRLKPLHNKKFNLITLVELENLFKNEKPSTQSVMKRTLTNCYQYGMKHDYVKKNLSEFIKIDTVAPDDKRNKTPFTASEIKSLWNTLGTKEFDDIPLILLYTGMRISEIMAVENKNVNLHEKYIDIKESKTTAGVRRLPLHEKIIPLITARYDENNRYLITTKKTKRKMSYVNYLTNFWYCQPHTIHETRHTFITGLNKAGVDDLTIKRIVGHANKDVTENYTHRTFPELLEAVNKLEY
jgi:integrase